MTAFGAAQLAGPKLKLSRRLVNTLLLLLLFRLLVAIPALNVDEERLRQLLADNPLIGTIDLFAGGETLTHFSIAAAGIFPYLMAMILVQIASVMSSRLREIQRQGETGKKRLELLTRILTIPIAFLFAWSLSHYLSQQVGLFPGQIHWFTSASFWPSLWVVVLITSGSLISTAISDLITRKGIGSGANVVLLGGSSLVFVKQIIRVVKDAPGKLVALHRFGWIAVGSLIVIVFSIYLMSSKRNIPIEYPRRQVTSGSRRLRPSLQARLPLLLNYGRILPVSSAIGVLALLQLAQGFFQAHAKSWLGRAGIAITGWVSAESAWYWLALGCLIVLFTYMYNFSILWQSETSLSDNLKKQGAYIPGVRPGQRTEDYISRVISSISLPGGLALALLAAGIPYAVLRLTHQNLGVTVLSLVVVVITVQSLRDEVTAYYTTESYEGFLNSPRKKRLWDYLLQ